MGTTVSPLPHVYTTFVCCNCGRTLTIPIQCGDRFCYICSKRRSARIRARLVDLYSHVRLRKAYTFKFLTLTIPSGPDLKTQFDLVVKSFRRLRQRKFWLTRVDGGGYVIELTVGDHGLWHVHLHVILYSAYLPVRALSSQWSRCSPGKIVHITMISGPQVARYISKYVSKSLALDRRTQYASDVLKGSRLFQPFGSFQSAIQATRREAHPCEHCGGSQWTWLPDHMSLDRLVDRITTPQAVISGRSPRPPPQLALSLLSPLPPP